MRIDHRIQVTRGDITRLEVDAIVNAANSALAGGGGVDGAIHLAAGPGLLEECETLGGCPPGEARVTGAYALPANWVIHAVGPVWRGGNDDEDATLASAYRSALELAATIGARTVAFPSISTGIYGYPIDRAAAVSLAAVRRGLEAHPELKTVTLVCFTEASYEAYTELLSDAAS